MVLPSRPGSAAQGKACCDVVNRGAPYADGRVFFSTLDNHTIAVDADTGEELWKTKLGEVKQCETMAMASLVVKGTILVGNSGAELGVRGWIEALDSRPGAVIWRADSTGPDRDVLIGSEFRLFFPQHRGKDLGATLSRLVQTGRKGSRIRPAAKTSRAHRIGALA